jgi:hypothetical protein
MKTHQSSLHNIEHTGRHEHPQALVVPIALDIGIDFAVLVPDPILTLVQKRLALALRIPGYDKLGAFGNAAQRLLEDLAIMNDVPGGRVVSVVLQYGVVVARGLEELRRVEVPAEVVVLADVLVRELVDCLRLEVVLIVEEGDFGSHGEDLRARYFVSL